MANTFTGTDEAETISPGFVSPTVQVSDATAPGDAEDEILPGGGGDTVDAGGGNDTIIEAVGATGGDAFDGGPGDDRLEGRAGRDTLEGGIGDDIVDGGGGDDLFVQYLAEYELVSSLDLIGGDTLHGRAGTDTVDYSAYTGRLEIDLGAGFARFPDDPGDEDSLSAIEDVLVGSGGGTIRGSIAANRISAFTGSTAALECWGFGGNDDIGLDGDASLYANGGAGRDIITLGGAGEKTVFGGGGNDRIDIHDSFGVGGATIHGGGGNDRIEHFDGQGASRYFGGGGRDMVEASAVGDLLVGGPGRDTLFGRGGSDVVNGGGGNDLVYGDASFVGGNGFDTLAGGAGDDVLVGGFQADDLYGGPGDDRFVFRERLDDGVRAGESKPGKADRILGFRGPAFDAPGAGEGDLIDVSAIDARESRPENQRFRFGIETEGGLWLVEKGTNTVVRANADGDVVAEFELVIADGAVRADDYARADFML